MDLFLAQKEAWLTHEFCWFHIFLNLALRYLSQICVWPQERSEISLHGDHQTHTSSLFIVSLLASHSSLFPGDSCSHGRRDF